MILCGQAATFFVNMYANAFIARAMEGKPPPELPPPAVGPPPPPPPAPIEGGPPREPVVQAAEEALGDVFHMLGVNQGAGPQQPAAVAPAADPAPAPPAPPAAREARRVRGGLAQLPARRLDPRRRQGGIAGPGTPQAPRETRVAQPGDEVEGARVVPVPAAGPAIAALAGAIADEAGPLPPETPPHF